MRLTIIAVGGKMPAWVNQGFDEYSKRLPAEIRLELKEVPLAARGRDNPQTYMAKEAQAMRKAIPDRDRLIALDVKGKSWSTEQLAQQLSGWQMDGDNVSLLIGGPDGIAADLLDQAHQRWSLSALTLPHPLVRVVLAEQLYRAWTITAQHPYHRS